MTRVDWHRYFMNIAREVAQRATCPRKHVGAVIVRDKRILSTGYNGSLRGLPHCDEVGCLMEDGHCTATVHAEANAILQAAINGVRIEGGEIYTTASPCWNCFKLIANAGLVASTSASSTGTIGSTTMRRRRESNSSISAGCKGYFDASGREPSVTSIGFSTIWPFSVRFTTKRTFCPGLSACSA